MVSSTLRFAEVVEAAALIFQVIGIASVFGSRLLPCDRLRSCCRIGGLLALVVLGVTAAACTQFDSKFALFGGATMTFLLIGMTWGSTHHETTLAIAPGHGPVAAEA
ncbi:MAG: hypothetical protein U0800_27125 [Isosphaeraceae bacterium]